eukprot:5160094-Amphidinium_carterae.1
MHYLDDDIESIAYEEYNEQNRRSGQQQDARDPERDQRERERHVRRQQRRKTGLPESIRTQAATPREENEDETYYYTGTEDTTVPTSSTSIRRTGLSTEDQRNDSTGAKGSSTSSRR